MSRLAPSRVPAAARRRIACLFLAVLLAGWAGAPGAARALVRFDFEQKFLVDPGIQTWDFCLVRDAGTYHVFYTSVAAVQASAMRADTLRHATSPDLVHWTLHGAVLTAGPDDWDGGAVWAPDVVRDEAAGVWAMAYTGADGGANQRIGFAVSDDLFNWTKSGANPVIVPDTALYAWDPDATWSDFRDPFLYRADDLWHILVTAKQDLDTSRGVIYHATSPDLAAWQDIGPLFVHDGLEPWRVLESPQYHRIGTTHHLFFGEFYTVGVTVLSAADPADWTMADRVLLDDGYAPEIDEFDPGRRVFSRLANYYLPNGTDIGYVVRFDTLLTDNWGADPTVHMPHPLDADWVVRTGSSTLANPTFEDNPVWRGEPSVGLVGHGYYGSAEFHQGPLSGRGAPGIRIGDGATGVLESYRFPVTGARMTLLVGGGDYPATCRVELVDEMTGDVLHSETGGGGDRMTLREWDLTRFQGRLCFVRIEDAETGPMGHINVDEIVEHEGPAAVPPTVEAGRVLWHRPRPNPANPRTDIVFALARDAECRVDVHDVRGRLVWSSGPRLGSAGVNRLRWSGRDGQGLPAATGTYLYSIAVDRRVVAAGKITLVK